jgi:hypothetical protein
MQTRRAVENVMEVDRVAYRWVVCREPQWSSIDGWKGLSIEVTSAEGPGRRLLLELPFSRSERRSTPQRQRPKVVVAELQGHIREALAAGWVPASRGKPFVFEVGHEA